MKPQKRVPSLRFTAFSGDYHKYEFSEIASRGKKTYNPNRDLINYKCVELESLSQNTGELLSTFDSIELKSNKTKFVENDVLFGKLRPYLKKYWLASFNGVCTSEIWVLKGKLVINPYLFYLIQTEKFNYEANITTGSKMPRADWDYVSSIKYLIPAIPEQQKIAAFLSAVDKKIEQLHQKQNLLEDYKKGVMQQLFSQQLRFTQDDGSNYPDWVEKKLGDICDYKNGGSFEKYVSNEGIYKLISLNSIDINGKLKSEHKKVTINDNSLQKGDLVMVLSDVAHGYFLGLTDIIPDENFVLNQRMGALKPKDKIKINSFFLKSFINFNQKYFKLMGQGSSQQNLSKGDILNFKISKPILEEQTKIANFISAIDQKIIGVQTQIEHTQQFKKGLLQQMFV